MDILELEHWFYDQLPTWRVIRSIMIGDGLFSRVCNSWIRSWTSPSFNFKQNSEIYFTA